MAIHYEIQADGDLLKVKASGMDENLAEVTAYGAAIIQAAQQHNTRRILCDETDLIYKLNVIDNFEAARFIAERVPCVVKVAIVCKPDSFSDAQFWETVAVNRGLLVKMFKDPTEANAWLQAR